MGRVLCPFAPPPLREKRHRELRAMGRWLAYKKEVVQLGSIGKDPPPCDWELVMDCDLLREGIGLGRVGERGRKGLRKREVLVCFCLLD